VRKLSKITFALWLAYVLTGSIFLNLPILPQILDTWREGHVKYRLAISPLPGVVYLKEVWIAHQDRNVRWNLRLDSVWAGAWLPGLFDHKLEFFFTRVNEARFYFVERKRLDEQEDIVKSLYPQTSFPEKSDESKGESKKWRIEIRNVSIKRLSEAWVNEYRYLGSARISGKFEIHPDTKVSVGPAVVQFNPGDLYLGITKMAEGFQGTADYLMKPFAPDASPENILRSISLNASFSLKTDTLEPLNFYLRDVPWLRLNKGSGPLKIDLKIAGGLIRESSRASYETPSFNLLFGNHKAEGPAKIAWEVYVKNNQPRGKLSLELESILIRHKNFLQNRLIEGGVLKVKAETAKLDIADKLFSAQNVSLEIIRGVIPQLAELNTFLPKTSPVRFESGTAVFNAQTTLDTSKPRTDTASVSLQAPKAKIKIRDHRFKGNVSLGARFEGGEIEQGLFTLRGAELKLTDGTLSSPKKVQEVNWWGTLKVPVAKFESYPKASIDGNFDVEMRDSSPLMPLIEEEVGSKILAKIADVKNVRVRGNLKFSDKTLNLQNINLQSSSLKVQGHLETGERVPAEAHLLFIVEPFAAGLELKKGRKRIILNDAFGWYKR
jgi:hypothetical protein